MPSDDSLLILLEQQAGLLLDPAQRRELLAAAQVLLPLLQPLAALDTAGVEPLLCPHPQANVLREDTAEPSYPREQMLAGAPHQVQGYLCVPGILPGQSEEETP